MSLFCGSDLKQHTAQC